MNPCFLCEVVSQQAGWNVVDRTELTMTVLNLRQYEAGQCMVLPVRHVPTLLELSEAEGAAVMLAARKIADVLVTEYQPDGVLLYQNNGVGSGQEVPHFHLHVVPRTGSLDWGFGPPHIAQLEKREKPPHLDHSVVTDQKLRTAAQLRKHFNDGSA
jgi:diadenosine tetraphosphate (Ap4A) HIT family hydrolase